MIVHQRGSKVMDKKMEMAYEMRHICAWFIYLSLPRLGVMNDSVLTQVEGYSYMGGRERERETETDSKRGRDRKRVRGWIIDDTNFSKRVIKIQEIGE